PRRATGTAPTHLVHDGRAYAIDERPLVLGTGADAPRQVKLRGQTAGISRAHCTLAREAGVVVMRDHSRYGCFVNGERVEAETVLAAGDRLRLGTPGIVLELVAAS
ncbi:MAG: FHA domain-containing protein, partial [Steroidobacteraceae bacterium]